MLADLKRHKMAYSLLAVLSSLYIAFIFRYQTNQFYLLVGTGTFALTYFSWGVFHHLAERSLQTKIVLEYFLVASLAIVIVATLLV